MKKLTSTEVLINGTWIEKEGDVYGDEACKRIEWLTENVLEKLANSREFGAWETLFRDPEDGRLWERFYPHGEMHGGGPPALRVIGETDARCKYDY